MIMVAGNFQSFAQFHVAAITAALAMPAQQLWLYFSAIILSIIGLPMIIKKELLREHGLDRIVAFGRLLFAVPLAVFGTEHFVDAKDIAGIVPDWLPVHMFFVYLVGAGLIAAALSIVVKIQSRLAATLLGIMFLIFVALIHIPGILANPHDRIFWAVGLRDISFGGGAFALRDLK